MVLCTGKSPVISLTKGPVKRICDLFVAVGCASCWINSRIAVDVRHCYAQVKFREIYHAESSDWLKCLKSSASWLFTQPFIQTQIKENIKAPCHWPLCGEFTGTGEFPTQRASYAENVSIWWRHNDDGFCPAWCHSEWMPWRPPPCMILREPQHLAGLILGLRTANERRRYFVTTSPIGWAQA